MAVARGPGMRAAGLARLDGAAVAVPGAEGCQAARSSSARRGEGVCADRGWSLPQQVPRDENRRVPSSPMAQRHQGLGWPCGVAGSPDRRPPPSLAFLHPLPSFASRAALSTSDSVLMTRASENRPPVSSAVNRWHYVC